MAVDQKRVGNARSAASRIKQHGPPLGDTPIRGALEESLCSERGLVVHELPIAFGYVRLDVALIGSTLDGYEIKSDRDRLDRLERQLSWYLRVCDRLTVVTTQKHRRGVLELIPRHCGVILARDAEGVTMFEHERDATPNPQWDVRALLLLLWQTDTQKLAATHGVRAPHGVPKALINEVLASKVDHDVLRLAALEVLRSRSYGDRANPGQSQ